MIHIFFFTNDFVSLFFGHKPENCINKFNYLENFNLAYDTSILTFTIFNVKKANVRVFKLRV